MDGFFSNEISNTLQMFTFPMEVIGLTLAAIEVRFPVIAAKIQLSIEDDKSQTTAELERGIIRTIKTSRILHVVLLMYFLWAVFIGYSTGKIAGGLFLAAAPIILIPFLYLIIWLSVKGSTFLLNWVPDRSVGTLGIIIAGFGVLGEAYQFAALMLT
jgi:hypothetical protein